MRIRLKKGKQRELILLVKGDLSWKQLGNLLNCSKNYLSNDLKYELRYLSEELYKKLCSLSNQNFDKFIIKKLDDNWGRSKGGISSSGNLKNFNEPVESTELAELFGIIIGDGHVEKIICGKKIRCYSITVAGDSRNDRDYLSDYVSLLFNKLFNEKGKLFYSKSGNGMYLKIHGKKIVQFVEKKGIANGNKKSNNQSIPDWILKNDDYLKAFLRGLIDTDGCIYYISKTNKNLRISFTSYIPSLMIDVKNSFLRLGFHPSKIIRGKDITITRKEDTQKFINEIGFSNNKHLKRLYNLTHQAPIV